MLPTWPRFFLHLGCFCLALQLRKLFSAYGLPEQLVFDNGPQFLATKFTEFLTKNGVKHIKSAPYHPSSNGAVERFIQTFKKSVRSGNHQGLPFDQYPFSFLLTYRSTAHSTTNSPPCMLFLKRQIRTRSGQMQTVKLLRNRQNKRKHMMNTLVNEHFSLDKE